MASFNDSDSDDDMFGGLANMDLKNVVEEEDESEDVKETIDSDRFLLEDPIARIFKFSHAVAEAEEAEVPNKLNESEVKDDDAEDSYNRDMSVLVQWIEKSGGYVHPKLTMAPFPDSGVGGCILSNDGVGLKEDELLIRVPAKCIIFSDDASIEGLRVIPSEMASMDLKQIVLALALIEEIRKESSSEFAAYVNTLPSSLRSFPIMWSPTELELLKTLSPETHSQVVSQAKKLRTEYDHIKACSAQSCTDMGIGFEEYIHAKLLVASRCFGIGSKGDVALLPMIDMLNHSLNPHVALGRHQSDTTETACESDDNSFELKMIRPCKESEEIFSSYDKQGTRTAVSWLLNYGFVPEQLTHESGSKKKRDLVDGAAIEALRQCGPHTHGAVRLLQMA